MEQIKKKYRVETLGCRTNQYESAAYIKQLKELGFTEAQEGEQATVCIVNTCTVTEGADKSSRQEIRRLSAEHVGAKLIVTGCLAERAFVEVAQMPGVDLVVRNKEKEKLIAETFVHSNLFPEFNIASAPEFVINQFAGHTRAFVKVQDGCNSFCTYCIIPYVRGRSRSRSVASILKEIEDLIAHGYQEVVLTGINVGDFDGGEKTSTLADLVKEVDQLEGLKRLRISSIDPDEVDGPLLEAVLGGKTTCPSMHLVLQSGSNSILKKMNRKYTCQQFLHAVQILQRQHPDFTITTDVIVGFPGETEEDFVKTLEVIEEVRFAKVHMFPYSPRDRTRAALYPGRVKPEVIHARKKILLEKSQRAAFELRQTHVGRELEVLIEEISPAKEEENRFIASGYTANFLKVDISLTHPTELHSNQLVLVKLIGNELEGLKGQICKEAVPR